MLESPSETQPRHQVRLTVVTLSALKQFYAMMLVFSITFLGFVFLSNGQYPSTYDELYSQGIRAYSSENWETCIRSLENALSEFKTYRSTLTSCRLQCGSNFSRSDVEWDVAEDTDLGYFDRVLRKADCLKKCKEETLGSRPDRISEEITNEFLKRVPYAYLQLAYYKTGKIVKAATATFTYLVMNPEDEMMQNNLGYYRDMLDASADALHDLELLPYQELFIKGRDAYGTQDWQDSIDNFEGALEEYYVAHGKCQALCEGSYEHTEFQDLYISIATHYLHVLECQDSCEKTISVIDGSYMTNYVAAHYHYLQFAYYQVGEVNKAVKCAVTYLLFVPDDEVMAKNMLFYEQQPNINGDSFQPRQEARDYFSKITFQQQMRSFAAKLKEEDDEGEVDEEHDSNIEDGEPKYDHPEEMQTSVEVPNVDFSAKNVTIVLTAEELNGTDRMAADGFATQTECETLIDLALASATEGDGYSGKEKPHTSFEKFVGLRVLKAAEEARAGRVSTKAALSYLELSERARHYVEVYFKLPSRLYFSYTHLVCRTAEPDSPKEREDLSHPIHADNCWLDEVGHCYKEAPAFTWRDYSAILYLNSEFQGGEFIFAKFNKTIESTVQPKCGRLVSFSAGKENLHGVKAVLEGRRCALALWFTLDKNHDEKEYVTARTIMDTLVHDEL